MKRKQLHFGKGFRVAIGNRRTQAAEMVIAPGETEGGPENRHRGADQWLFVVSGSGQARIKGKSYALREGALNFYSPPAYRANGDELPRAKP